MAWYDDFFPGLYREVLPITFDASVTRENVRILSKLLRLRRKSRVLDVPCGMGRISIPLAQAGMAVTGVDFMESYLERGRRDAKRAGVSLRFVRADMRRIDFDEEFDAAFNWFGSFGYFSERGNLAFAKRVHRALVPGGRFLVEGINKPWLLRHFEAERQTSIGKVRIQNRATFERRTSRIHDQWTLTKSGKSERHRISIRIYSGPELRALLRNAGFSKVELFGYPPLGPLSVRSRRLIAVGTK